MCVVVSVVGKRKKNCYFPSLSFDNMCLPMHIYCKSRTECKKENWVHAVKAYWMVTLTWEFQSNMIYWLHVTDCSSYVLTASQGTAPFRQPGWLSVMECSDLKLRSHVTRWTHRRNESRILEPKPGEWELCFLFHSSILHFSALIHSFIHFHFAN